MEKEGGVPLESKPPNAINSRPVGATRILHSVINKHRWPTPHFVARRFTWNNSGDKLISAAQHGREKQRNPGWHVECKDS